MDLEVHWDWGIMYNRDYNLTYITLLKIGVTYKSSRGGA